MEVDLGGRAQLQCTGDASPPPMLFWYKEGHRQLLFPPSTSNTQVSRSSQWPQAAALASTFSMPTSDTTPAINKLFTMPLNSDTFSQSSYSNNYFGNRIYVDERGTLNIVNATLSDNGHYACALISAVGSVMAKAKLTVKQTQALGASTDYNTNLQDPYQTRSGSIGSEKYELLPPPVIKMGTSNQTLPTNTTTTLLCDVVSQVAYKIQWSFDAQPLQEDPPRVTVLESGALNINNLRTSDSGIYTCVVTAASDQNMPLASPFEPLDASMLTSAPPIQQSTSHSCMLKVANPINPNIPFFRMDIFAYPSSPGAASLVSTNGNDAITIAWAAPADSGTFPIRQYVVEHYDTSQEQRGWRVIHRLNGKESLLIDGLSADGSHFFVVRAANSQGTGPSSAIAGPMRTVAGEARYQAELQRRRGSFGADFADQRPDTTLARDRLMALTTNLLSLTPVSPSSIKLHWSIQHSGNSSYDGTPINYPIIREFLEGYSVRYRAVGFGESLIKNFPIVNNWFSTTGPSSLPLVTSFVDEDESVQPRNKREVPNLFDYSLEFNEVKVADPSTEHFTVNGLRPFTMYQFFIVPFYKDIDGVPSNILSMQTNEDRPSIAPPNLTIRPINNTSIRLLWLHIPLGYANGILRGYTIRVNQTDILETLQNDPRHQSSEPMLLDLPLSSLNVAPLNAVNQESRTVPISNGAQHYIVMYDLTNLTHKSFYSVQVAGLTSVGSGPWSEVQNFVMDPKILTNHIRSSVNEFDDVMSKSMISSVPQTFEGGTSFQSEYRTATMYLIFPTVFIIITILLIVGFLAYRRNNQKVTTWKKTISEHFTNKFYMPSAVDHHHRGSNSIQQNIYDHQQQLIYSAGSSHMVQPPVPSQTMWANGANGCINSSGTGSLSSHGGLLPVNNDPNVIRSRINNDQLLLMNSGKDTNQRVIRPNIPGGHLLNSQNPAGSSAHNIVGNHQIVHHGGDYYSVINNVVEYEELDQQQHQMQRNNAMQILTLNGERGNQTASSNSDTSCPSSVTRLLPNQINNRDLINKVDQRHEMLLQQQLGCNGDNKQPFITMINGNEAAKFHPSGTALSPYATTNLMNQPHQQHFANPQITLIDHTRQHQQQNFTAHQNGSTMDDTSRILMTQRMNFDQNQISAFRTLQRTNPLNFQHSENVPTTLASHAHPDLQVFTHPNGVVQHNVNQGPQQQHFQNGRSNYEIFAQCRKNNSITVNPLAEMYERVDYSDEPRAQIDSYRATVGIVQNQQSDMMSASTSAGSVKSPQHNDDHLSGVAGSDKLKKLEENLSIEKEAHDLRVFSNSNAQRPVESNDRQRMDANAPLTGDLHPSVNSEPCENEQCSQADEFTPFRQKNRQCDENQRSRQLSKRKRQQQRNRLHNNNQKLG